MTSLENQVADTLTRIGFYVASDGPLNTWHPQFRIGRYRVDFALPTTQIAIEVDGDYWHGVGPLTAAQLKYKERDRRKHIALVKAGWAVVRIKEQSIGKNGFDQSLNQNILKLIEV